MTRACFAALALLMVPASVFAARAIPAASFAGDQSVVVASSSPGNAYAAGVTVTVTAPTSGDFSALGGSVMLAAPVAGSATVLGGSVSVRAAVAGSVRALGARTAVTAPVGGDTVLIAYTAADEALTKGSTFVFAKNARIVGGADGPVHVYGNNVTLAGTFSGPVEVVATGQVTVLASSTFASTFSYEAPEAAAIPDSVYAAEGVHYVSASYLPSAGTSKMLAFASSAIFLVTRIFGALILAGLLAGLFPRVAEALLPRRPISRVLLTALLGFAALVATPVLGVLLTLTFVGFGLALLVGILYALLVLLAYVYAGIILGALVASRFEARRAVLWRDGVIGMFALSLIALIPYLGVVVAMLIMLYAAGSLVSAAFTAAFPRSDLRADDF